MAQLPRLFHGIGVSSLEAGVKGDEWLTVPKPDSTVPNADSTENTRHLKA